MFKINIQQIAKTTKYKMHPKESYNIKEVNGLFGARSTGIDLHSSFISLKYGSGKNT